MKIEKELPYSEYCLSNGIRLVHRATTSPVAHCAITINVGSRDELPKENGIAHFIEHCIFKGTQNRKSVHILNRIDGVGGELNAFTTKEETCIYASFLSNYYDRVLELFADIVFNSTFPDKELEKEKVVIEDEINSYEDNPAELIYDDFEHLVFGNHGLGRLILGTPQRVRSFDSEAVRNFIDRNYATDLMVISTIGAIDFDKWVCLCQKYFDAIEPKLSKHKRSPFRGYKPKSIEVKRDTYQSHIILGNIAYSYKNKNKIPFSLLNNILGGPAMNSRLNMNIREKYGFTYSLESSYTAYSDTGIFTVYAGTDEKYIDKTISLIKKELEFFCKAPLKDNVLQKYKQQLMGQIAIQSESNQSEVIAMGKSLLNYNKIDSLNTTYQAIKEIQAHEILEVANNVFSLDKLSVIKYLG